MHVTPSNLNLHTFSRNGRRLLPVLLCVALAACVGSAPSSDFPDLQIGRPGLSQQVKRETLAEGLVYHHLVRGQVSSADYFTLSSGPLASQKASQLLARLVQLGHQPWIQKPAENAPDGAPLGSLLRVGRYASKDAALAAQQALSSQGIALAVRFSAEDGGVTDGPFHINILEIDLQRFRGQLQSALAYGQVQDAGTTSKIAQAHNALAAVNAGFFAWNEEVGVPGEPAGIAVVDGLLVSEAVNGRPALMIRASSQISIQHNLRSQAYLSLASQRWTVDGFNRKPGLILNCGNPHARPVTQPAHDFVCHNNDEILIYNRGFGQASPAGGEREVEFALTAAGEVSQRYAKAGNPIPDNGFLVRATGSKAKLLKERITEGGVLGLSTHLLSDEGRIEIKEGLYLINGGPTLLRSGKRVLQARAEEGWATTYSADVSNQFADKQDALFAGVSEAGNRAGFYHAWVVRRHPRTAIGLTADKRIFLVTVDGRQPGVSVGASLTDMQKLMAALGATEAINLDGGGSTAMVVSGRLVSRPSDQTGERAVGDALLILPEKAVSWPPGDATHRPG